MVNVGELESFRARRPLGASRPSPDQRIRFGVDKRPDHMSQGQTRANGYKFSPPFDTFAQPARGWRKVVHGEHGTGATIK